MAYTEGKQPEENTSQNRKIQGLSADEVRKRRTRFGENRLPEEKKFRYGRSCLTRSRVR